MYVKISVCGSFNLMILEVDMNVFVVVVCEGVENLQ